MKRQQVLCVLLILALLNCISVQAGYFYDFHASILLSYQEYLNAKITEGFYDRGTTEVYRTEYIKYLDMWTWYGHSGQIENDPDGFCQSFNEKYASLRVRFNEFDCEHDMEIKAGESVKIFVKGPNDRVWYADNNPYRDLGGMCYKDNPTEGLNIQVHIFQRSKPEQNMTLAMAVIAANNDQRKWRKAFQSVSFQFESGNYWEGLERSDQVVVKLLNLKSDNYFGLIDWHNHFPIFEEINFGKIVLPDLTRLDEASTSKDKCMSQALGGGDYFACLVPESINDCPLTSEYLSELFPRGKTPGFALYGSEAWQNGLLQSAFFNSSSVVKPGLNIIRKKPLTDSYNKAWCDQIKLIPDNHLVPNAATVELMQLLHYVNCGEYLTLNYSYRTSDQGSSGDHIYVTATSEGLDLWDLDDGPAEDIGLASAWKI